MRFLVFIFLSFYSLYLNSQCLVGTWNGYYITNDGKFSSDIKLVITLNEDSSYKITCNSMAKNIEGFDTIISTEMKYQVLSDTRIKLTEIETKEIKIDKLNSCFQIMDLSLLNDYCNELRGKWFCKNDKQFYGYIKLSKSRTKGIIWGEKQKLRTPNKRFGKSVARP